MPGWTQNEIIDVMNAFCVDEQTAIALLNDMML